MAPGEPSSEYGSGPFKPRPGSDAETGGVVSPAPAAQPPLERPGDQIGPFKLLSLLGEGGFGTVWLAERREPFVQRVALKLIKPGMDSKAVLARFEQERQALAVMNHPGIARVLDGGLTPAGRPYFAMEYVRGEPITDFCDSRKLGIKERLALFEQVCEAIQHAHLKGIVHRDIKPGNILAFQTDDGRPAMKVIDFGVAKAMSHTMAAQTIFTDSGVMVGTLEYMSPEQTDAASQDIDTRSDIYSLGVLLYEILTGAPPFDPQDLRKRAYGEIQRIIREVDPPSPSGRLSTMVSKDPQLGERISTARHASIDEMVRQLRTELEWIPLKAMRKERQHRYQTALELANDIRAYIDGRPIAAAPESATYRLRKYVRRNRALVAGVGAVAAALVVGVVATGLALQRALSAESGLRNQLAETQKAQQAEKERAEQLKKVSDFQAGMLGSIDTKAAGEGLIADVRERFAAALEKAGVPAVDREAQAATLGSLLTRVNATDAAAAMIDRTILKPAIKTIDERFKDDPATDASLRQALADLYRTVGLYDAAFPLQESALFTRRHTLGEQHLETIDSIKHMGLLLRAQGKLDEAEPYFVEALEKRRRALGEEHPDTIESLSTVGRHFANWGFSAKAEPYLREALEKCRRWLGDTHPHTLDSICNVGFLLDSQGKLAEAETYYREALEKRRSVLGEEHTSTLSSINMLGSLLYRQGKLAEAEPYLREALEKRRRTLGEEHPDTLGSIINMGLLLESLGKLAGEEPYLREAFENRRRALGEEYSRVLSEIRSGFTAPHRRARAERGPGFLSHPLRMCRLRVEGQNGTLVTTPTNGFLLQTAGRVDDEEQCLRRALEMRRRTLGEDHLDTLESISNMGFLLQAKGKFAEAEPYYREALEKSRRTLGEEHLDTLNSINNMASLFEDQGKLAEAEPYYREALEKSRRTLGEEHPDTLVSINNMGFLLQAQGKLAEAEPYLREALENRRRSLGEEHPNTLRCINNMGFLLQAQGKLAEAEPYYREALEKRRRTLGEEHPSTVRSLQALVDLYSAWDAAEPGKGHDAKAAEWRAKLPLPAP